MYGYIGTEQSRAMEETPNGLCFVDGCTLYIASIRESGRIGGWGNGLKFPNSVHHCLTKWNSIIPFKLNWINQIQNKVGVNYVIQQASVANTQNLLKIILIERMCSTEIQCVGKRNDILVVILPCFTDRWPTGFQSTNVTMTQTLVALRIIWQPKMLKHHVGATFWIYFAYMVWLQ